MKKKMDPATMKRALPIKIRFAEIRWNLVLREKRREEQFLFWKIRLSIDI